MGLFHPNELGVFNELEVEGQALAQLVFFILNELELQSFFSFL